MITLGERELVRRSWASGSWAAGQYTAGGERDTTIRGTFRPMPARQVQLLASGDRERDPRVLYTAATLYPTSQHDNQPPDHISPDGGSTWYEVTTEYEGDEHMAGFSLCVQHRKYSLLRVQESDA